MKKLGIIGSRGKMGSKIIELLREDPWKSQFQLVAEIDHDTQKDQVAIPDVLIDFSNTESTLSWSEWASKKKIPYLICTTGFKAEEFSKIKAFLSGQPWAFIPNTSLGVYAFIRCLCGLVAFFKDIRSVEIHEVHHVHKKDTPSGTAILIKAALLEALKDKKLPGDIQILSGRDGEVVGIHTVVIQRAFDRLIFTHEAQDRKLFAEGALSLAQKLASKSPREKPYTFDELL